MKLINKSILFLTMITATQLYGQVLTNVLEEDFNDNSLEWDIDNESNYSSNIKNGKYIINNTSEESLFWANTKDYKVDQSFTIETQITRTNSKGAFMFLSNFSDWESPYLGFVVDGDMIKPIYFNGSNYANGGVYAEKIEDSSFKKNGNSINLKVECVLVNDGPYNHQEMTFYVNGTKIGTDENVNAHFSLNRFGFVLDPNSEIEVDFVSIEGTPIMEEKPNRMDITTSPLNNTPSSNNDKKTIYAGESIYAMVYMEKTFEEIVGSGYSIDMTESVSINDEIISKYQYTINYTEVSEQGSTYELEMAPQLSDVKYPKEAHTLCKDMAILSPGVHEIKVAVSYYDKREGKSRVLGEVIFDFDNSNEAGRKKFNEMVNAYKSYALSNVELPSAKMTNPAIESSIKTCIIEAGWSQTPVKVIIMESEWHTVRDQYLGTILQRQINVAVVTKDENGKCMVFYPSIYQEYLGNGEYSSTSTLGGMHKIEHEIDCSNTN